ncbi:MAG TPA: protein translocase subunit SecF [bacterium]|nr:protein translocase subunit SecF [bacterium]
MLNIIQKRRWWFVLSGAMVVASLVFLLIWGLKPAIDFTGGTLLELKMSNAEVNNTALYNIIKDNGFDNNPVIQQSSENRYLVRIKPIEESTHTELLAKIQEADNGVEELRYEFVGPVIGQELKDKAFYAIILVIIAIVLYVAWAFRKVSYQVSSWSYGFIAVIALMHDILIVIGLFAVLGHFMQVEVGLPFVAALLTILGYSVNDTIVVFDRVRENLHKKGKHGDFEETVNLSVNETLARSINTSFTTLIVLIMVFFLGGATLKFFILALIVGITVGTYSSIFLAATLLTQTQKWFAKK